MIKSGDRIKTTQPIQTVANEYPAGSLGCVIFVLSDTHVSLDLDNGRGLIEPVPIAWLERIVDDIFPFARFDNG